MYIKGRYILSACLLLVLQPVGAAAMDCTKAANDVENTICANNTLYDLDTRMGALYRQLMTNAAAAQTELKRTQRAWLNTRNACADDVACLDGSYRQRLQALQAQWTRAAMWQPDAVDVQAMNDLRCADFCSHLDYRSKVGIPALLLGAGLADTFARRS